MQRRSVSFFVILVLTTVSVFGLRAVVDGYLPAPQNTPPPATPAANMAKFAGIDTSTRGAWAGRYGSQGYSIVADQQFLPSTIRVIPRGNTTFVWAASTSDARALSSAERPFGVAACWYAASTFSIEIVIADGQPHRLALYLLDWDRHHRSETISVHDGSTKGLLDTRSVVNFVGGEYLLWQVRGDLVLDISNGRGSPNAVVSGLFFAAA